MKLIDVNRQLPRFQCCSRACQTTLPRRPPGNLISYKATAVSLPSGQRTGTCRTDDIVAPECGRRQSTLTEAETPLQKPVPATGNPFATWVPPPLTAPRQPMLLVARHWEQVVKLPSFRMPEAHVQVPLVVPAPSSRTQKPSVWNVSRFRCPPTYGADYLGARATYLPQREHRLHKPFCGLQIAV